MGKLRDTIPLRGKKREKILSFCNLVIPRFDPSVIDETISSVVS